MTEQLHSPSALETEATPVGTQVLVPGVAPITARDRLQWRAEAPLGPRKAQRPCDHGLFDLVARNQLELFAPTPSMSRATDPDEPQ